MRYFLSTLTLTALASSCVTALGIDCRGSSSCVVPVGLEIAHKLSEQIFNEINPRAWYRDREHISCIKVLGNSGICAFLQGTNGLSGDDIKVLAFRIVQHGCEGCGGVPVYYDKGENDVALHGMLTFNWVDEI